MYLLGLPVFFVCGLLATTLSRVGSVLMIISTALALMASGYVVSMVMPNLIYYARECGQIK